jgi:hypothetical protein
MHYPVYFAEGPDHNASAAAADLAGCLAKTTAVGWRLMARVRHQTDRSGQCLWSLRKDLGAHLVRAKTSAVGLFLI